MSMPRWRPRSAVRGGCIGDPPAMNAATAALAEARLDRFLTSEPVVWLSTVRPDGAPHLVPIWFTVGRHVAARLLEAGSPEGAQPAGQPVACSRSASPRTTSTSALAEARAELPTAPATELPDAHLAKYADRMAALGLSPEEFLATYSQVMRITPTRSLPWHGRTTPRSVLAVATIEEPVPEVVRRMHGEPLRDGSAPDGRPGRCRSRRAAAAVVVAPAGCGPAGTRARACAGVRPGLGRRVV